MSGIITTYTHRGGRALCLELQAAVQSLLSLLTHADFFAVAESQVGTAYCSRACLRHAGVHQEIQAGVACTKRKDERYVLSARQSRSCFVARCRLQHIAVALQVVTATRTWEASCKRTTKTFCSFKLVGLSEHALCTLFLSKLEHVPCKDICLSAEKRPNECH